MHRPRALRRRHVTAGLAAALLISSFVATGEVLAAPTDAHIKLRLIASLLSMPASLLIDRTGARKKIFLWGLYAQRLLWFPIALVPVAMMRWYWRRRGFDG